MLKRAAINILILLHASQAMAAEVVTANDELTMKDYGVRGHLFNIAEDSLLNEIIGKLKDAEADGTLDKLQAKFVSKVKEKVLRPAPVQNITKAVKDRSWTYDPTYTQEETIIDDKGKVIVAAGTTVNALDKLIWGEPLIFIDGDDQSQVKWALEKPGKIVLTSGAPLELTKLIKRSVFFDQGGILCHRFKIESIPAVIEQDGKRLRIREIKL